MNKSRLSLIVGCLVIGSASSVLTPVATAESLQAIVQQTIAASPDVLEATHRRLSRDQEVKEALAGYLPSVDLTAGYGYEYSDNSSTRTPLRHDEAELDRKELGLSVRQMLFDGYGTRFEVERQRSRVTSTAYEVWGTAERTALRAVQVYLDVQRQRGVVDLAAENLQVHKRIQDQIRLRKRAGVGRKADLDQIDARVALAESNLVAARVNLKDAITGFERVVGKLPSSELQPVPSVENNLPPSEDETVAQALANHPILKSAQADIEAAKAQNRAAESGFVPHFNLEVEGNSNSGLDGIDNHNNDVQAMVRMRWNLYNGWLDTSRLERTASQISEAKEIRNRTHRQVMESAHLSWTAYDSTKQQMEYLDQQVKSSRLTRDAYEKQFNIGQRTLLDLLNTENELFQARQSLIEAQNDKLLAEHRILADLGQLTKVLDVTLPQAATVSTD